MARGNNWRTGADLAGEGALLGGGATLGGGAATAADADADEGAEAAGAGAGAAAAGFGAAGLPPPKKDRMSAAAFGAEIDIAALSACI